MQCRSGILYILAKTRETRLSLFGHCMVGDSDSGYKSKFRVKERGEKTEEEMDRQIIEHMEVQEESG